MTVTTVLLPLTISLKVSVIVETGAVTVESFAGSVRSSVECAHAGAAGPPTTAAAATSAAHPAASSRPNRPLIPSTPIRRRSRRARARTESRSPGRQSSRLTSANQFVRETHAWYPPAVTPAACWPTRATSRAGSASPSG
ncbi:hypothetical protein GCM10010170_076950 [Dactylosporangium salmoneum]|uniref:Secreted protein n=1 Tax=Dactylosporangium salmoneum TaxID=53361 RepID=A0ABP5UBY7_9ACTN